MASRTALRSLVRAAPGPRMTAQPSAAAARRCLNRPVPTARAFSSGPTLALKKYTEDHEWIDYDESSKIGTIGVTAYAANALGDVVYVELPAAGTEVSQGDAIGAVESVKSASDIMTPVSGTVQEANGVLEEKPGTINKSPEADGWIAKITLTDAAEMDALMDEGAYKKFSEEAAEDH